MAGARGCSALMCDGTGPYRASDCEARLFGNQEQLAAKKRPPGFLLPDGCEIRCIAAGGDSSIRMATASQPRSLLSIARLNMARSRARPSIWSFVRIDQT